MGALAVIVYNNVKTDIIMAGYGKTKDIKIPSIFISKVEGEALARAAETGTALVSFHCDNTKRASLDTHRALSLTRVASLVVGREALPSSPLDTCACSQP